MAISLVDSGGWSFVLVRAVRVGMTDVAVDAPYASSKATFFIRHQNLLDRCKSSEGKAYDKSVYHLLNPSSKPNFETLGKKWSGLRTCPEGKSANDETWELEEELESDETLHPSPF